MAADLYIVSVHPKRPDKPTEAITPSTRGLPRANNVWRALPWLLLGRTFQFSSDWEGVLLMRRLVAIRGMFTL